MQKYSDAAMIGGLIGIMIFVVIFASVIPTVASEVAGSANNSNVYSRGQNVTGAANSLLVLVTLVFVAIGIVAVVNFLG